ncbi:MAG: hypothetical protein JXM73_19405 [Anaerolineae bacterium]|nr:hypothetical protein [Anaerolineae bacterium]
MPYSSAVVLDGPVLSITYTLYDPESDPARLVKAFYSLDGGSTWHPAIAAAGTITTNLAASPSPTGTQHTYTWDIYSSGVLGACDNAVLRLDVYQGFTGPGPYQFESRRALTLPFRLRGSQVRVMHGTDPAPRAIAYRLPGGQSGSFEPYRDGRGRPFRTNPVGYLAGYGEIALGDELVALLPITHTGSYTLYYTSAAPTPTGLDAYTVSALGVQTLTVSAENALVLFNPTISLEWDARKDEQFLAQLQYDLGRTSEFLYDWTNGQAALGRVTVYHDRQYWNDAYMRVYATNQLRPSAVKGGIVSSVITDPLTVTVTYAPGQVRMGATWNRYGDPGGSLGEDWPRTLAHELAHFALFQDDNYLGLDEQGRLIPIDSCTGTAMTDPYRDDYSELHPDGGWLPACEQTLSHRTTGRSDWATVEALYPWLHAAPANAGPIVLPLALTRIQLMEPITSPLPLEVPIFTLFQDGGRVVPGAGARAYLFQDGRLVDLGQPTLDQVLARGARAGDRLCLFHPAKERLGCEVLAEHDRQLDLVAVAGWQPQVLVTPVTSRTLEVVVTNAAAGLPLQARLFPANYPAPAAIALVEGGGQYGGTFLLDEPTFEGTVQVWVEEPEPRREVVTGYALGGNPGHQWSRTAPRGSPGHQWSRTAPVMSSDGQMMLFGEGLEFEEGEFLSLQALSALPLPPAWATVVGQAYRLAATLSAPDLAGASVAFGYLGSDVPPGEEPWLKVYFWDGAEWQPLPTEVDLYYNVASAPARGPGTYSLMSSLEIPLYGPGWNNFGYPVNGTRPIGEALAALDGFFTTVYGWEETDPDPLHGWRVYDVTWDPAYNTLHTLAFGQTYWITVTQDITLYLKGGLESMALDLIPGEPPATFYGAVLAGSGFSPFPGMEVTAWVGDRLCGRGETMELGGRAVYRVSVLADSSGYARGCGQVGRTVRFEVNGQAMASAGLWDNSRVWEVPLMPGQQVYLPLITRHR